MRMMGIFGTIEKLTALADDPAFAKTGEALVNGARDIPLLLKTICNQNGEAFRQNGKILELNAEIAQRSHEILEKLDRIHGTLVEISLGLDILADPIARPPFKPADIEAAMNGVWPPQQEIANGASWNPARNAMFAPTLDEDLKNGG